MFDLLVMFSPKKARRHPFEVFFFAFAYATISIIASFWLFEEYASLTAIFLTIIPSIYLVQRIIITEEKVEQGAINEISLLKRHSKMIFLFLYLFLGFLSAFAVWRMLLPEVFIYSVYNLQQSEIEGLRAITGNVVLENIFSIVLLNNLKVLFFSLLFAFFYGAGFLFILTWNASIMGYVIGSLTKETLGFSALPLIIIKYSLHGIPEIAAYFIGALVGGMMFMVIARGDFNKEIIKRALIDAVFLILISVILLVFAAIAEVYVSSFI